MSKAAQKLVKSAKKKSAPTVRVVELLGLLPCQGRHQAARAFNQLNISVRPRDMEQVLDSMMYPTGRWLAKVPPGEGIGKIKKQYSIKLDNIDNCTVLLYDVPAEATTEEVQYIFEDYILGKNKIRKVSNPEEGNGSTTSFLVHFEGRMEAERAVFEMNASTFAGSQLHMYLYN